ncbi:MAG: recombinase family protein [Calditrichae bacterium]|nr:recombinase family protein [Calditrichia bacterium]
MKIAIYCRVSTSDQTPENQRIRLTEYAREKEWECEVYTEVESTRNTRPVKAELLHKLRDGKYDGVLVYKLDRWARSSTELVLEIRELVSKGVVFISYTENLDFSTSTGRLHFQILSAFAEFERDLISERTKEGIYRARIRGKTLGRPKGSKDKKKRRKADYYLREARKKQQEDQKMGMHRSIEDYLNNETP